MIKTISQTNDIHDELGMKHKSFIAFYKFSVTETAKYKK